MIKFKIRTVLSIFLALAIISVQCQKEHGNTEPVSQDQYVKYTIGTTHEEFVSPSDSFSTSIYNSSIGFVAYPKVFADSASWQFSSFNISNITSPGTYNLDANTLLVSRGSGNHFTVYYSDQGPISVTITEFGNTGGFIAGSFSGTFWDINTGAIGSGTCTFRLKRRF